MNKSTSLCLMFFLVGCQVKEQRSDSIAANSSAILEMDSASYREVDPSTGHRALLALDSSARAALKNDWKEMKLYGRVKSIIEDGCLLRGRSEPYKPCKIHCVYEFNEFGFLITVLRSTFEPNTPPTKYVYDSTGQRVVREDEFCYDGSLCAGARFKYDDHGNKIEAQLWREGKDHEKYVYQFDKNRMVAVGGFAMNKGGERFMTETKVYDDHDNLVSKISIHREDTTITTFRYKYDQLNRVSEQVETFNSRTYKYDRRTLYSYNDLNQVFRQVERYRSDGREYKETTSYRYNSNGQLVEEIESGRLTSNKVKITYDETSNWIKKMTKDKSGSPHSVEERIIEYY